MSALPFESIKRKVLVKRKANTSDKFGKPPEERTPEELMKYGFVNIDKPSGPTSHQVAAYVRDILKLTKAGHSGTLDPNVTGVLPVAIGNATRIAHVLLTAGKEYVTLMHLHKDVDEDKIKTAIKKQQGLISQLPPLRSAVKREVRERMVYYIELMEIDGRDVLFKVGCQAGTYIRRICDDIGKDLGIGAHMQELRRTKTASFDESSLATLQDLTDSIAFYKEDGNDKFLRKVIQNVEVATQHLPKIWVLDSAVDAICHGSTLKVPGVSKLHDGIEKEDLIAVFTLKDELIGFGTALKTSKEILEANKGTAGRVEKIFMPRGVYPRFEKVERD